MNIHVVSKKIGLSIFIILCSVSLYAIVPHPSIGGMEPMKKSILKQHPFASSHRRMPQASHATSFPTKGLLILAQFTDVKFDSMNTQTAYDSLANSSHYTFNGATGSCKQYFENQSNGTYSPQFDVIGPVTLPHTAAYYGKDTAGTGNDRYIFDFVYDACLAANNMGVDFSQYDFNRDNEVDLIYIVYAGYGQADGGDQTTIWPHSWDVTSALYFGYTNQSTYYVTCDENTWDIIDYNLPSFDGKTLITYACSNELNHAQKLRDGIGTICHEFCHLLGLPDYYITDNAYNHLKNQTPGSWSIMGSGNYLNESRTPPNFSAYDKYFLGWAEPTILTQGQTLSLPADQLTYYQVRKSGSTAGALCTDTVYYIENRQYEHWDAYLPGHGMLIWQVIYNEQAWVNNSPNGPVVRYTLLSADNTQTVYTSYAAGNNKPSIPFPGSLNVRSTQLFGTYLNQIEEVNGVISFSTSATPMDSSSDIEQVESKKEDALYYNVLGIPVDPNRHKGIAIHNGAIIIL